MALVLVRCDGRTLEVRRVGEVKVKFVARSGGPPIKAHGWRLIEEDVLAPELRELADSGLHERVV